MNYRDRTLEAQAVLRGEAEPRPQIDVRLGVPLDLQDGVLRCPACSLDGISLIEAVSYPAGGNPLHAGVFLACTSCSVEFVITVDRDGGRCLLGTARKRR